MTSKTNCAKCEKSTGQFKCEGCSQVFCMKHVIEHRQLLIGQLDGILLEHDILQQATNDIENQTNYLMEFIKQWEEKSIEKIRRMAQDIRQKLFSVNNHQQSQSRKTYSFLVYRSHIISRTNHITTITNSEQTNSSSP